MTKQIQCACVEIHIGFALECAERKSVTLQHIGSRCKLMFHKLSFIKCVECIESCISLKIKWKSFASECDKNVAVSRGLRGRKSRFCCISPKFLSKPHYPKISRSRLQATNRHTLLQNGTFLHFRNVTVSWIESAQCATLQHLTQFLSQRGVFTGIKQIVVQVVRDDVEL